MSDGLIKKLDGIAKLEKGWDSYAAPPPHENAIKAMREFLDSSFLCPLNDGRVELSFKDESVRIVAETDGSIQIEIDINE